MVERSDSYAPCPARDPGPDGRVGGGETPPVGTRTRQAQQEIGQEFVQGGAGGVLLGEEGWFRRFGLSGRFDEVFSGEVPVRHDAGGRLGDHPVGRVRV